jgi:oligosaccharyltransferase complex subunit gamma
MRWASGITLALGAITLAVTAGPYLLPVLQNRMVWGFVCTSAVLLFTSGHMFNQIRHVPYIAGDGKGGISYFSANFQNQLGLETQIVAALCKSKSSSLCFLVDLLTQLVDGLLAVCAVRLAHSVPRIAESRKQQVAVLAWGGILFLFYSFLLSVFRIKNGGYPLSLPPFM